MNMNTLRRFLIIAEEMNMRRAAERLHTAQPALTRMVHQMEEELGFPLFDRSNKRQLALSPAGQAFVLRMTPMLEQYEEAIHIARRIAQGEREQLVVGYVPAAMVSNILPLAMRAFERVSPGELILRDLSTQSHKGRIKALREHRLDALLEGEPGRNEPGIAHECVGKAPLLVALPHTHQLAQQEALPLVALAQEAWIQVPRSQHPPSIDKLTHLCQQAGFDPRVVRRVPHIQAILSLVAAGIGITLVTAWAAQRLQQQGVVYRPLLDVSCEMELYLLWRMNDGSSLLHSFLHMVREVRPDE
jgi:DNA-binding transcriptional LysR family regulator